MNNNESNTIYIYGYGNSMQFDNQHHPSARGKIFYSIMDDCSHFRVIDKISLTKLEIYRIFRKMQEMESERSKCD